MKVVVGEEEETNINDGRWDITNTGDYLTLRHASAPRGAVAANALNVVGANVLYCDGHVETMSNNDSYLVIHRDPWSN